MPDESGWTTLSGRLVCGALLACFFLGCDNSPPGSDSATSADRSPAGSASGESTINSSDASIGESEAGDEEQIEPGWGDLQLVFIYDGDPPAQTPLNVSKEPFCTANPPLSESLVINPQNRGIANIVVSLFLRRGAKPPDHHPSYDEQADASILLDNRDCRFQPHVLAVRTGQTLLVKNSDKVGHNTKFDSINNGSFNSLIAAGGTLEKEIIAAESFPVPVQCTIHPWMSGRLVITEHPYVGISDENGLVSIPNLPSGKWTFQLRHADSVYLRDVNVGGTSTDTRGTVSITIRPGENDLGQISVPPSLLSD